MWDVKAAEDGDREAQFKVAETYQHGSSVVQASMPAAAKMYEAAAKQGHLEAARRYAHCLLDGNGVDKDAAAAVEWFGIAAEGGHVDAQFQLGLCYHAGTGTAKDLDLTIKWLQKAGEQRNVEAQYRLGMIFQQSISADQVSPLNAAWYRP
jgi:TPR repeat protein